jgi:macrolide-specific efflux system membrane fusion protein
MSIKKVAVLVFILVLCIAGGLIIREKVFQTETIHPVISNVVDSVYGLGSIKSKRIFNARVVLPTVMEKIFVDEGQGVKKDTPLFKLSEDVLVRAPFDGTVTHIAVHDKEMVYAQNTIMTLQDLKDLHVEVNLEQQGAVKIRRGQKAILSFDNLSNKILEGVVSAILPQDDKFKIDVDVEGLPEELLPGMSVDVTFNVASKESAILLPLKAVINGHISLMRNNKRVRLKVKTGLQDGNMVEILEPALTITDHIIMEQ